MTDKRFSRKRAITLPTMSFKGRETAFVRIDSAIEKGQAYEKDGKQTEPAWLCAVTDLETGEQANMICPTLLVTALTEDEVEYVGRLYEIHVSPTPREGKRYKDVTLYELNPPDEG